MKKYKFKGITDYGVNNLFEEDLESLNEMIGCTVVLDEVLTNLRGERFFEMPDGESTHVDFLILEEIQPKLST